MLISNELKRRGRGYQRISCGVDNSKESANTTSMERTMSTEADEKRGAWGNPIEFLLSTLGMAVGLGNIWRFPTRAYSNGGSAFLIPYISCALLFGLPSIYLEFIIGQYHRASAPIIFRRIAPILQGVGWMAVAVSSCVAIYYVIIIGWAAVYIVSVGRGHTSMWSRCDNPWNDPETCIDLSIQDKCDHLNNATLNSQKNYIYLNSECQLINNFTKTVAATEQYFFMYIVEPSNGFLDFNQFNLKSVIGVTICWIIVVLILWKGVDYMGKASYVIVTLPYVIIFALFIRGITLDGASDGIYYYLGNPDWSKVFLAETWGEALKQLCFSLAIGYGGLVGLASYNKPNNNCFRDALIVIFGDTIMSIIGGAAVFSTLGFLAKQRGCEVSEVVNSGFSLAFVAFPEAMSRMPLPWLWSMLFFIMIFLLGISTEVAYVNVFCSAITDHIPKLQNRQWAVALSWSIFLYAIGMIMLTDGGFYWFIMFDEYAAGVSSCVAVTSEVLFIIYFYGLKNVRKDMVEMFGRPLNGCTKWIGYHSPFFIVTWMFITPVLGIILIVLASIRQYPFENNAEKYPLLFDVVGWGICILPVALVPLFAIASLCEFKIRGYPLKGVFMKQKQLRSYPRIYMAMKSEDRGKQDMLPDFEPWDDLTKSQMSREKADMRTSLTKLVKSKTSSSTESHEKA